MSSNSPERTGRPPRGSDPSPCGFWAFRAGRSLSRSCRSWSCWRGSDAGKRETLFIISVPHCLIRCGISSHLLSVASPPLRVSLLPRLLVPLPGVSMALLLPLLGLLFFLVLLLLIVDHLRRFFVLLLDSNPLVVNLSVFQLTVLSKRSRRCKV